MPHKHYLLESTIDPSQTKLNLSGGDAQKGNTHTHSEHDS